MFDLKGFTAFNFEEGVPYISVTQNGMTFNKAVTMKLNYPSFVLLLISAERKQIVLMPCEQSTQNATAFYRPKSNGILSVRWNARDLINTLEHITGWDLKSQSYRINGVLLSEENAMLFDLNNAELLD